MTRTRNVNLLMIFVMLPVADGCLQAGLHEPLLSRASEPIARSDVYGEPIRILLVYPSHALIKSVVKDVQSS